jgi:hypothetical protein
VRWEEGVATPPSLKQINYSDWVLLMKVKLKAWGVWSTVESDSGDLQEDIMALHVLSSAMPLEIVSAVVSKDSTKEAWDVIKTLWVGADRVRASTT